MVIDIDFTECQPAGLALCCSELLENGRNSFAWPAPRGVEVDDCVARRSCDLPEMRGA